MTCFNFRKVAKGMAFWTSACDRGRNEMVKSLKNLDWSFFSSSIYAIFFRQPTKFIVLESRRHLHSLTQNAILLSSLQYSFCIILTTHILPEALPPSLAFPSNKRSHLFYCIAVHTLYASHSVILSLTVSYVSRCSDSFPSSFSLSRLVWGEVAAKCIWRLKLVESRRRGKGRIASGLRPEGRMREARREVTKKAGKPPNTSNAMHLSHTHKGKQQRKGTLMRPSDWLYMQRDRRWIRPGTMLFETIAESWKMLL